MQTMARRTYSYGISEHFLRRVNCVLEDMVPGREGADVGDRSSRVIAVNDIRVDHTEAVHRCGLSRKSQLTDPERGVCSQT